MLDLIVRPRSYPMAAIPSSIVLFVLWVTLLSCNPKDSLPMNPLPVDTWSKGCVQLVPDPRGFRLRGMCCEYIILPQLKLDRNQQFSVKAKYFTSTGAGFASQLITVNGKLSGDRQTLTLSYSTGGTVTTHELIPGAPTPYCLCGCG